MPFLTPHPLDEEGRCGLCRRGWSGFDAAYSYGSYEGTLRKLVHLLKYDGVRPLAQPLGRLALTALPREGRFDVIVPMPMHWRRRWWRGFNQSRLLAEVISRHTGIPVAGLIRRKRNTPPQARLSRAQRRTNVVGAFAVKRPAKVEKRRILLVDDVITTGATASACARMLKRAGAAYVAVLALARTDRRSPAGEASGAWSGQSLAMGATECV